MPPARHRGRAARRRRAALGGMVSSRGSQLMHGAEVAVSGRAGWWRQLTLAGEGRRLPLQRRHSPAPARQPRDFCSLNRGVIHAGRACRRGAHWQG
eukprot:232265-Chlamydomonas_euryale.AAC.2